MKISLFIVLLFSCHKPIPVTEIVDTGNANVAYEDAKDPFDDDKWKNEEVFDSNSGYMTVKYICARYKAYNPEDTKCEAEVIEYMCIMDSWMENKYPDSMKGSGYKDPYPQIKSRHVYSCCKKDKESKEDCDYMVKRNATCGKYHDPKGFSEYVKKKYSFISKCRTDLCAYKSVGDKLVKTKNPVVVCGFGENTKD